MAGHEMSPQEELEHWQRELAHTLAQREVAERKFRATTQVVIPRSGFDSRALGIRSRIAQLEGELNPQPPVYNPRARAKRL